MAGLEFCIGMNKSQRLPQEVSREALDFIACECFRPKVMETTRHHDYILNMDQTPVPFTYNARKRWKSSGVALRT